MNHIIIYENFSEKKYQDLIKDGYPINQHYSFNDKMYIYFGYFDVSFLKKNRIHREGNLPAYFYKDGCHYSYMLNGLLHNIYGASFKKNNNYLYHLYNVLYSKQKYLLIML